MFNMSELSDFKFVLKRSGECETVEEVYAHKMVLSQSPIFKSMFESNMMEELTNVMEIDEAEENVDAFVTVIRVMYGAQSITVGSIEELMEVIICLDKYQLHGTIQVVLTELFEVLDETSNFGMSHGLWLWLLFKDSDANCLKLIEKFITNTFMEQIYLPHNYLKVADKRKYELYNFVSKLDHETFQQFLVTFITDRLKVHHRSLYNPYFGHMLSGLRYLVEHWILNAETDEDRSVYRSNLVKMIE